MAEIDITVVLEENVIISSTIDDSSIVSTVTASPADVASQVETQPQSIAAVAPANEVVQSVVNVGVKGDTGPVGPQGDGLQISATGPAANRSAYDSELEGFSYLDTDNGLLYFRETTTPGVWSTGVLFGQGEQGIQGLPGEDGNTILYGTVDPTSEGVAGNFYINTVTKYIFGPKTTVWPAGTSLVGADGKTILYGTVNPTTEGVNGDFYINTVTKYIFGPKNGTWPIGTSLIGPQGLPGLDGQNFNPDATGLAAGRSTYDSEAVLFSFLATDLALIYFRETATPGVWSTGIPFGQGEQGLPGADGSTVLSGLVDPTIEGVDGDFYINYSTSYIFGPKNGAWPAGKSLVGTQGVDGTGLQMDAIDTLANRVNYDAEVPPFTFFASDTQLAYFKKTAGASWSAGVPVVGPKGDTGDQGIQGVQGLAGLDYVGPGIYVQTLEPPGAVENDIWIDTSQ